MFWTFFFTFFFICLLFFSNFFLGVELATLPFWELKLHVNGRPCEGVELAF